MADVLVVDPRMLVPYYTYVIRGLLDLTGVRRVHFRRLAAPLRDDDPSAAMELRWRGRTTGLYVATGDADVLNEAALEWADVYGKTNLAPDAPVHERLTAIGPCFGIRLWPLPGGYVTALRMSRTPRELDTKVREMRFQGITRRPIADYVPGKSDANYVFHASRAWADRHEATNEPRHRFLEACASLGIEVDGGIGKPRMDLTEYLRRTRRSAVVFNSPAVHQCLGWKLGEYLALGKAIVSTPLTRQLPAPLVHGEHIHLVADDTASIAAGVDQVMSDAGYRRRLEHGARAWYEEHLAPDRVASRMLQVAQALP